jgi:hypothetical protein
MQKSKRLLLMPLMLLAGCASYEASMLTSLPVQSAVQSRHNPNVLVTWKIFNDQDSKIYLGRDLISEGYIPIQMTIRNNSSDPMYLHPQNFSVPLPPINEVANKVHTSTAGRVAGWGVPGLLIWPLLVPAIYDGIKSKEANAALDADYFAKAIKEQTIQPHSSFNGVFFLPKQMTNQPLEMFLVNQRTNEKVPCSLMGQTGQ